MLVSMDPLADVLDRARVRGALFAHSTLHAPWGVAFEDHTPLSFHAVLEGELYVEADGHEPLRLLQGDLLLVRVGGPYRFVHRPGAPAVDLADFVSRAAVSGHDRRYAQVGPGPRAVFVCGSYTFANSGCESVLGHLPELAPLRGGGSVDPAVHAALGLLADEVGRSSPGQQIVLDRLLELLLVYSLRTWFSRSDAAAPAWFRALDDPQVGRALRLMHADPARSWTVASLAAEVGLSRAAFARRFGRLTGEPPLAYLSRWRMSLAREALRRPGTTVAAVAGEVGYANEFAFAAAFKREHGVAPGRWRRSQDANAA
jgi:AraC-like DNA-binding protein